MNVTSYVKKETIVSEFPGQEERFFPVPGRLIPAEDVNDCECVGLIEVFHHEVTGDVLAIQCLVCGRGIYPKEAK